jgi:hypothetical protein
MKITDKVKLATTLGDMAGNVFGFCPATFWEGWWAPLRETLYRAHWYSSEPFYFVVIDWEPCAGLWKGTMTTLTTVETHTVDNGTTGDYVKKFDSVYKFDE